MLKLLVRSVGDDSSFVIPTEARALLDLRRIPRVYRVESSPRRRVVEGVERLLIQLFQAVQMRLRILGEKDVIVSTLAPSRVTKSG